MNPPLPIEILHHIIKLSLPVVSFGTYRQRYDLLLAYSLVNSTWRALARKELYEELFVEDTGQAAAALSVEGAREAVKRVHLGDDCAQSGSDDLKDLALSKLGLPQRVEEFRVTCLRVNVEDLPSLSRFEALHLHWFDFGYSEDFDPTALALPSSPAPLFASLLTLSLIDPGLFQHSFPPWNSWFTPTTFPVLRHFSVGFTDSIEDDHKDDFRRALAQLAPQLTALAVTQGGTELGDDVEFPWDKFTALETLVLYPNTREPTTLLRAALQSIPNSLSILRIGDSRDAENDLVFSYSWEQGVLGAILEVFAEATPSVEQLKQLSIQRAEAYTDEAGGQSVERLIQVMEARGGLFTGRLGWEGGHELLDWERFIEPW